MKKNYKLAVLMGLVGIGVLLLSACTIVISGPALVSYDGNNATGGSIPVGPTLYTVGDHVTIMDNTGNLVKNGSVFVGWNTNPDGSGTWYYPNSTMYISSYRVILYAQWMPWNAIPGTWDLTYTWDDGIERYAVWTINNDKTFYDDQSASGTWSISVNTIEFHYQNGISYIFSFLGSNYISSDNRWGHMQGTMRGYAGSTLHTGTWSATQLGNVVTSMARSVLESGSITPSGEVVK